MPEYYSDDPQIIEALNDPGKKEAGFEMLVRKYYRLVQVTALHVTNNPVLCMDITHNVFLSIWKMKSYQTIASWPAYLVTVTQNEARKQWKKSSSEVELKVPEIEEASQSLQIDTKIDIQNALAELPPQGRQAVRLVYLEGLQYADAARQMGIGIKTLETHLSRAKSILNKFWNTA